MPKIVESKFTKNFLLIIFVKICLLLMNYILKVKVLVAQSCPTLCDLVDYSLPGSSVLGLLQAKILEWVAISFSGASSRPRNWTQVFHSVCLQCGRPRFDPWVGKIPWRRKWQPTPVFLPGESHGRRSLVGYSPRGRKELDATEQLILKQRPAGRFKVEWDSEQRWY